MIFRTPIEKPSSRHPYSEWYYYQHLTSPPGRHGPKKLIQVWHAAVMRPPRSRATTRHTVGVRHLPVVKPGPWVGPSVPSKSTGGHGPLINPF